MSTPVRVYLPITLEDLAEVAARGRTTAGLRGHAVTDGVRREWADSDEEQQEYEALCLAADDAKELWTATGVRRRVVLAVDAMATALDDPADPSVVLVEHEVPLRRIAAVHADTDPADAAVDADLCWFAVGEIDSILG